METLKKILKSAAFREILRLALAALAGAASSGCGLVGFGVANSPALDVFACQVAAFEAVVPPAVAEDLVMAARAGNIPYVVGQLRGLDVSVAKIQAVAAAFDACDAADGLAEPEPAPLPATIQL